jgi:hypothetical protein
MKKLLISLALLVMVGSAYAASVTDNPIGGLYPIHLRRAAKSYTVSFQVPQETVEDTAASTAPWVAQDTVTQASRLWMWRAPHDCKIDSFYVSIGGADSIKAADSARVLFISNNSGTNGDTIICDTLTVATRYSWTKLTNNLADTAKNIMAASKTLTVKVDPYGSATTSRSHFWFEFTVTPSDR